MKNKYLRILCLFGIGIQYISTDNLILNSSPPVIYTAPVSGISGTLEYWRAVIDGKEIKPADAEAQMKDSIEVISPSDHNNCFIH